MNNPFRMAFAGFRHGHIFDLHQRASVHPAFVITAAAEDDPEARATAEKQGVQFTHKTVKSLLDSEEFDVLAVGDYFGRRGSLLVEALSRGKHVIADKPICTSLDEWKEISRLSAEKNLKVGCMLDLRACASFVTMRQILQEGQLGEVQTVQMEGQHPLLPQTRPSWYFEEGKQGGTINDIAIHAMDLVPWLTGHEITRIVGARTWNAKAKWAQHFKDCAQFLLELRNGGGVIGDVSYLAPDGFGFQRPQYWRIVIHGTRGFVEGSYQGTRLILGTDEDPEAREMPLLSGTPGQYLEDFWADLEDRSGPESLHTAGILKASRVALEVQRAADENSYSF